ncbi:MAG: DUF1501 domain-containing protein [Verrucomicrobia bacterium]|nr:DUF1501 domain-containing protein [Verrucomicrobiota bacterium]NDB76738.1 DUF1501 domain-containing protein [Verrucomicrobiota bacterium]NDD40043.1 DUF1501 domain-containing protein [Verrucomicrobiota bacterium]NDF00190.1 DUF1501 domain-containing protein [Verrucomicrobiota bacterium]
MLTLLGNNPRQFCDGQSRRDFLRVGALGFGGLSLADLLRVEAHAGIRKSHKAIINIFLPGGPPHQDMFDLKPNAPQEIRGELRPINTNVPGIQISELLPRTAAIMDKLVLIRSVVGAVDDHNAFQCQTGRLARNQPPGGWPSLGSVLSKLQGATHPSVPPFFGLAPRMGEMRWADAGKPGFLGVGHAPFRPSGAGKDDMVLDGLTLDRLDDRKKLLTNFDHYRRDVDSSGLMDGLDSFTQQAFGMLTSSKVRDALDLDQEDPKVRARYGKGDPKNRDDGGPKLMEHMLMARRLVEAGARCVTLAFSRWDHHGRIYDALRQDCPLLDQGFSALIEDLHQRGLDKDVTVILWGEFGRTPKINKDAGRDHWPAVSCALLAGGGLRTGQVIGSTDRHGGEASDRPVHFGEIFATLYNRVGLEANQVTIPDLTGRPQYLVDGWEPIKEVV